ncbi:hypothetical protein [Candidatus Methylomicrobium oryzae]|uniref:hypothetical protein n=1 Tax=Candidatus Methylomicrobium oryzae TaxID=2802053 RepID=UPI001923D58B|nr:hypothetical protein [Methylomicrobium sp. RS1]MBL1263817.1 hypothetical protein [Methylomicrobium sp. RS1]
MNAENKIYNFHEGINAEIKSASDCVPILKGKVSLGGDGLYIYNYECRNKAETAQYNITYQSKLNFALADKGEAENFFNEYLKNKIVPYLQSAEITNVKYSLLSVSYKSSESSNADYVITYNWNGQLLLKQGRFIFKKGYIADWSVKSEASSGEAAKAFDNYVKYFDIII